MVAVIAPSLKPAISGRSSPSASISAATSSASRSKRDRAARVHGPAAAARVRRDHPEVLGECVHVATRTRRARRSRSGWWRPGRRAAARAARPRPARGSGCRCRWRERAGRRRAVVLSWVLIMSSKPGSIDASRLARSDDVIGHSPDLWASRIRRRSRRRLVAARRHQPVLHREQAGLRAVRGVDLARRCARRGCLRSSARSRAARRSPCSTGRARAAGAPRPRAWSGPQATRGAGRRGARRPAAPLSTASPSRRPAVTSRRNSPAASSRLRAGRCGRGSYSAW